MGWIPKWGSLDDLSFSLCSIFPFMSILFHLLRRTEASTLWSSFFLSFMWSLNCILGSQNFWTNIYLSVSAYHVCFFVFGLHHSGWYFLVPPICQRISWIHHFYLFLIFFHLWLKCVFIFILFIVLLKIDFFPTLHSDEGFLSYPLPVFPHPDPQPFCLTKQTHA